MGAVIKATGVSASPSITSSIAHAAEAGRRCVAAAGIAMEQLDLLINVGVYRDCNMVEPAMSALIQRELGLGLDYVKHPSPKVTFSFDLMNGAVGMMNAIQVASAYLSAGNAEYVLLVSSDAHPSNRRVDGFPYASVGSAMLLEKAEGRGFGRVQVAQSSDPSPGVTGFLQIGGGKPGGRERISIERDASYEARAFEFALHSAKQYAQAEGLNLASTTLVSSQLSGEFAAKLARRLEAKGAAVVEGLDGDPHTSALTFAHRALPADAGELLFVAVGAGLTSACAVYRP